MRLNPEGVLFPLDCSRIYFEDVVLELSQSESFSNTPKGKMRLNPEGVLFPLDCSRIYFEDVVLELSQSESFSNTPKGKMRLNPEGILAICRGNNSIRKGRLIDLTEEEIAQLLQNFYIAFGGWMRYQYKQMGQDKCLTLPQFQVLFKIKDFGICNMSSLSEAIEVSKGTMTSMLNKLVEEGYVERSSSLKDRRNVYVSLTQKGEDKLKHIKEKLLNAVTTTLLKLEEGNKEEIYKGLESLMIAFKGKK